VKNKTKVFLARTLRRKQTDAERKLWSRLRGNGIPGFKFRRQFPIKPYFADFCCVQSRLVVELDGGQHVQMKETDRMRTKYIEKHGYRVVRFWDSDVLMKTDAIMEAIYAELQVPSPLPSPAIAGEGVKQG
jgi:adenine-specific DNA-methyltransferase